MVKNKELIFKAIPFGCFDIPLHANSQKQLDYGGYINRAQYLRGIADELQQLRLTNEGNGR